MSPRKEVYMYVVLDLSGMSTDHLLIQTSSSVILPTDLEKFEAYSRRIKHIHLSSFRERVSSHIYNAIARHLSNKNSCLFPALRCFSIPRSNMIPVENLLFLPLF